MSRTTILQIDEPVQLICWCCKHGIKHGDLHVFTFAQQHRRAFVPKGRRGIFHLCGRCCKKVPTGARRFRLNAVHIHTATASSTTIDGYAGRYKPSDVKVEKRLFSIALTTAERYLDVTAERCHATFANQ